MAMFARLFDAVSTITGFFGAEQVAQALTYQQSTGVPSSKPNFIGEWCFDTQNGAWYKANGIASSADWAYVGGVALTAAELAYLDGQTPGAATASKALIVGSSKEISGIGALSATSVAGIGTVQTAVSSAQFDAVTGTTGATLTNVVGLVQTVVAGTYKFKIDLHGVSTANSGLKAGLKLTTTVLTSIESMARGMTASGLVVQHSTTATDQASLLASTTAIINGVIEGTMVVGTGGTIQVQAAQNAAHADTTSVYAGSTFELQRIA